MLLTTTSNVEGARIVKYIGLVSGEAIIGANFIRDWLAGITDIIGGRAAAYEQSLQEAKDIALREMSADAERRGANAVLGITLSYESIVMGHDKGTMMMVTVTGTGVVLQ